ncbi:hypothetical protein AKJ18_35540, partial [Vibrio xuii]
MNNVQKQYSNKRMSKVVIHNDTVYLCGQVGVKGTSVAEQTEEALKRVEDLLIEAGSDRKHVLQTIVWL